MNKPTTIANGRALPRRIQDKLSSWLMLAMLSLFCLQSIHAAGSATWNVTQTNGIWYSAPNWTPATVPNTISDTATFGVSNITTLTEAPGGYLSNLGSFVFTPGASAYTITFARTLTNSPSMIGAGVMNDSGILQTFFIPISQEFRDENQYNNVVWFINSATAGTLTQWTVRGSSYGAYRPAEFIFSDTATAASATIIVSPGGSDPGGDDGDGYGGLLNFKGSSTADHATITVNGGPAGGFYGSPANAFFMDNATAANATITTTGGTIPLGYGGFVDFYGDSTAASATITNQGGAVSDGGVGLTTFRDTATAGNATLIANAGVSGAHGGVVNFYGDSTGGTARCELFGNGKLAIGLHDAPGVTVGSVEGNGLISLGTRTLTVGSNNLSTTFSGTIQDGASLTKIGTGTLILSGGNRHSQGTTVNDGTLLVNNRVGSGTGKGPVSVNAGTLGGSGIIAGNVTVGDGVGEQGFLMPGGGTARSLVSTTVNGSVYIRSDGVLQLRINSKTGESDRLIANGVTIEANGFPTFVTDDLGRKRLPAGRVFTLIENTSSDPIVGSFVNLHDGDRIAFGRNNFIVSFTGGDGNDLTFTVE
jgi:autotransporter-associated beta strand protein